MIVRIRRDDKEIELDLNQYSKIEMSYVYPMHNKQHWYSTGIRELSESDPEALRRYKVFVGDESITVVANPADPVSNFLQNKYLRK